MRRPLFHEVLVAATTGAAVLALPRSRSPRCAAAASPWFPSLMDSRTTRPSRAWDRGCYRLWDRGICQRLTLMVWVEEQIRRQFLLRKTLQHLDVQQIDLFPFPRDMVVQELSNSLLVESQGTLVL